VENLEERKKEFKERLTNELFIERYDTFKQSISLINMALENFRVNYQYTYDQFCIDFTNESMEYMDKHPEVDMMDPMQLYFYTLPIVMSIIDKAKNKYGIKNE
jgi:hypothetical protein